MLNYCGVSGPVVFSIEAGSYPAMELGKIPGSSSTNTVTFVSASGNRDAVVIGEGASPALKMENTSHVTFRNVTIGSATNAANQVAVQFMGYIENVLFHHCNLYVQASTTNSSSHVVDYNNTNNSTNYLKDVRFIGNEVRGGYYGFYLYYAGGNAANCKTSAANRASVRIDSNYIYDQYYYPVYSYYYTYIPSFSHNTIKSRLGASYSYGVYFYYYNLVDSVVGNRLNINVSSYAYGGIRLSTTSTTPPHSVRTSCRRWWPTTRSYPLPVRQPTVSTLTITSMPASSTTPSTARLPPTMVCISTRRLRPPI